MVGSEQVYHSTASQYGGSKPEVVNKKSEKLERMVYLLFYTRPSYRNKILTETPKFSFADSGHSTGVIVMIVGCK